MMHILSNSQKGFWLNNLATIWHLLVEIVQIKSQRQISKSGKEKQLLFTAGTIRLNIVKYIIYNV